jgi:hypothetical protein
VVLHVQQPPVPLHEAPHLYGESPSTAATIIHVQDVRLLHFVRDACVSIRREDDEGRQDLFLLA